MRRFLNKLFRDFRTTSTTRGGRGAPRRAALQVEGLEDRLVMSGVTVHQFGSLLLIQATSQNHITFQGNGNEMKVLDTNGKSVYTNPNKQLITTVDIQLQGGDSVVVDDSNGMPFGQGGKPYGTTINLSGFPKNNTLTLQGSRGVAGNETYAPGGDIQLDNLLFNLKSGIASVTDKIQITGTFDVQTSSSVALSGSNGSTQQLSFTGGGGGGTTLTYANKPEVFVDQSAPNAFDFLDATAAATGEQSFTVNMHAAGDNTTIDMTPSNVVTNVSANVAPVANNESVTVWGNGDRVVISGNSSTQVSIGFPLSNGLDTTRGIQADVWVFGASSLSLSDSGNQSTQENVMVTEYTISGSGLFGNDGVTVVYEGVAKNVNLVTGQEADEYTVVGSQPGAMFTTPISITDFSGVSFTADVIVDSGSMLNLQLPTTPDETASLSISAVNGMFNPQSPTLGSGTEVVTFAGGLTSQISYGEGSGGFNDVTLLS